MRVACIVLAHRAPEQLGLLLSALRSPALQVYLHLDSETRPDDFRPVLDQAAANGVLMLERRRTRWAGPELVDAAVEGLARGARDGCAYFLLISGQDFPIRPVEEILAFLERNSSTNYLRYWPLPASHWRFGGRDRTDFYTYNLLGRRETCIPAGEDTTTLNRRGRVLNQILRARTIFRGRRTFPSYVRPVGGIQWFNLSRSAAEHVLTFLDDHPDYRRYHQYTLAPDELFFHSILLGTNFAQTAVVVNDDLRYMDWKPTSNHPRVLTAEDLPTMLDGNDLFARKLDVDVDRQVVIELLQRLRR